VKQYDYRRSPYLKLLEAYERGGGCRLTAAEVSELLKDSAIHDRAVLDRDGEATGMPEGV
jgi:hypothetical protein